jgi:para-nitrobenzyl esterase
MGTDTLDGVFHLFLFTRQNAPGRKALSDAMMSYVAQFARTGNPNTPGSGLPAWTPWSNDAAAPKCMLLDVAGSSPVLSMSTEELTDANVMARVRAELAAPLATATLDYLASSTWPASVR